MIRTKANLAFARQKGDRIPRRDLDRIARRLKRLAAPKATIEGKPYYKIIVPETA